MGKTGFRPERDGFAFVNSWRFAPEEEAEMRRSLAHSAEPAADAVGGGIAGFLRGAIAPQIERWIDMAAPEYYGLCGGMAFAAADFYRAGRPLPAGYGFHDTPNGDAPAEKALRDYLWRRQMESFGPNAPKLLGWMAMLHLPLPFAGPDWLLERTREELAELEAHILANEPWPICLIGSSLSPFNNHQVLATGIERAGPEQATVFVYDMNCPGREQTLRLNLAGPALVAEESCPIAERGPLRGFFCEHYSPAPVPDLPDRG